MEDIIHEIFTVGPNFKEVNNFLWPFKLNNAKVKGVWWGISMTVAMVISFIIGWLEKEVHSLY